MHSTQIARPEPSAVAALRQTPGKLFVETTTRCNLNCPMCVKYAPGSTIGNEHMSAETFAHLTPAFKHLDALILNGIGEPLLHPQLEEFIALGRMHMPEQGWIGFQSNGLLLDSRRAETLLEAGLDAICLSLDGASAETFRKVRQGGEVAGVERAFAALNDARAKISPRRFRLGVEFVVRQDNLAELPAVIAWAARRGANFAIVSQLMPYAQTQIAERAYDSVSDAALAIFDKWRRIGAVRGLDITTYLSTAWSSERRDHLAITELVAQMKAEARDKDVFLNLTQLFQRDAAATEATAHVFAEAESVAARYNLDLRLPAVQPRHQRHCRFVEDGGAFIAWDGAVHPCYNLWHGYRCFIDDWNRYVTPKVFGNVVADDLLQLWNRPDFRRFRENVLIHDYPYCSNCSVAPCDYIEADDFEQDCFLGVEPCGACLWSMGLLQCLQ